MPDVLDRIGNQLLDAEHALHLAAFPSAATRKPSTARRLRSLARRHLVIAGVLMGASAGAGGIAIADALSGSVPTDHQYLYQGQYAAPATTMTPAQTADLAILRRAVTSADAIPAGAIISNPKVAMGVGEDGANVALARLAQESNGIGVWVMPANEGLVCLAIGPVAAGSPYEGGGPGCMPATAASISAQHACAGPNCNDTFPPGNTVADGDLFDTVGPPDPRSPANLPSDAHSRLPMYIAGVLPDGVSTVTLTLYGGATKTFPVQNNVFLIALQPTGSLSVYNNLGENAPPASAPATLTITFNGPNGTVSKPLGPQGTTWAFAN